MSSKHSIEEYRQAVKILKLSALKMKDQNKYFECQVQSLQKLLEKGNSADKKLESAILLSRQHQAVQNYKQKKKNPSQEGAKAADFNQEGQSQDFLPLRKEQMLKSFKNLLQERHLSMEMFFRCCDKDYEGFVSVENLSQMIFNRISKGKITQEQLGVIVQALDEDCNGIITFEEFNKCITCYNLNEGVTRLSDQRAQEKAVIFRIIQFLDSITNTKRMAFTLVFDMIASFSSENSQETQNNNKKQSASTSNPAPSEEIISQKQIKDFLSSKGCELKDMEFFALGRVLDPLRTGNVEKKAFVREMNAYSKMLTEKDIDREMQSFSSLLDQFKIDPVQAYKIADTSNSGRVEKKQLLAILVKLAPRINTDKINRFLDIIDSNGNGEIDENEYLLALSQDETAFAQSFGNQKLEISPADRMNMLDKFLQFLSKNSITPKELFGRIDRNQNGSISMLEMKFSLFDLGFELSQICMIMKAFDTNSDNKIEEDEFIQILSEFSIAKSKAKGIGKEKGTKDVKEVEEKPKIQEQVTKPKNQSDISKNIQKDKNAFKEKKRLEEEQQKKRLEEEQEQKRLEEEQEQEQTRQEEEREQKRLEEQQKKKQLEEENKRNVKGKEKKKKVQQEEEERQRQEQEKEEEELRRQKELEEEEERYRQHEEEDEDQQADQDNKLQIKRSLPDIQDVSAIEAENDENNKFHSSALLEEENQRNEENQDDNDKEQKGRGNKKDNLKINTNSLEDSLKSRPSSSSKKSVKFNLFDEAEIQALVLNEQNIDFNMFFEQLNKQSFKDSEFPPNLSSITADIKTFEKAKDFIWKKASEIYPNNLQIFQDNVDPGDIKQGGLGDCYFLSSLSVLAEREGLIKRLFVTKETNISQCYAIWICKDSQWVQIVLDEYLPCRKEDGSPAFSRANGEELWVLLLEKCYAKIYGAYDKIEAGQTIEAIKDLTGAPGKSIKNEDPDIIWDFILTNERKNFILTCGSQSDDRGLETKKETGIVSSHAYGILDAQEVKNEKGQISRLIKMRNPWGSMEWNGDWSDGSKKWTPKIRQQLNYNSNEDDGIFWMDVKDYIKEFSETSVNYLHDNYFYSWHNLRDFKQKNALFQFQIKEDTHCYLMLSQKSDRHFSKVKNSKYTYSILKQFLFEIDPTTLQPIRYLGDHFTPFREGFIEAQLSHGTYALAVEVEWLQDLDNDAVISIYSDQKVNLAEIGCVMNPSEGFTEELCKAISLKDFSGSKTVKVNKYEESPDIVQYYEQLGGYIFFVYVNKSSNATLEEEISLTGDGYALVDRPEVYSSPSPNTFSINVPPQTTKVALFKMQGDGKSALQFTIGTSYSVSVQRSMDDIIKEFTQDPDKGDQRTNQGKPVEYFFKVHQYDQGFVLLYQNKTKNLIGVESIQFQNTNLKIVNTDISTANDKVKFEVPPNSHYGIILEIADKKQGSGLSFSEEGTKFKKA